MIRLLSILASTITFLFISSSVFASCCDLPGTVYNEGTGQCCYQTSANTCFSNSCTDKGQVCQINDQNIDVCVNPTPTPTPQTNTSVTPTPTSTCSSSGNSCCYDGGSMEYYCTNGLNCCDPSLSSNCTTSRKPTQGKCYSPPPTSTPPNLTVTPSIAPYPELDTSNVKACMSGVFDKNETIYPPNSACYAETKRTQLDISTYPKTCIKEPLISYTDTRGKKGSHGYDACYGKDGGECDVYVTVTTDVSKAELGSYGPSYQTLSSQSIDYISQNYLFSALFDKPYTLADGTNKEAWRTYWRLLPFVEQANLTAQFLKLVDMDTFTDLSTLQKINNTKFKYIDPDGNIQETSAKDILGSLPDCLKQYPVCDDYAKEYSKLSKSTKAAYDALIPLSFNNLRGFIALVPPKYPGRAVIPGSVSRENIPYVETIFSGLLSNKFGLMANIQPSWLFSETTNELTDPNTGYDLTTGKGNYISGQFKEIPILNPLRVFDDNDMNVTVLDNANIQQCADFPNVYNISAPRTYPKNINNNDPNHLQEVKIPGSTLQWDLETFAATEHTTCPIPGNPKSCSTTYSCPSPADLIGTTCYQYKVTGSGKGKALTVFNNPKVTDIKNTIIADGKSSLYYTLMPASLIVPTPTDKKINAPTSDHTATKTEYTGNGSVTNKTNPIIRENNQAQDTVKIFQNCWLVPGEQQIYTSLCGTTKKKGCGITPSIPESTQCSLAGNSFGIPDIMIKAINFAGSSYKVPPSLILGILYGEGAFNPGSQFLDSGFVEEQFQSCSVLPSCNPDENTINNIISFSKSGWDSLKDSVKILDKDREPNACNLLDGIFALAKDLYQNHFGSKSFAGESCFGILLNSGKGDATSCSDWSQFDIETAIRVFEAGTAYNNICFTKENSCLLGGSFAATCDSGGDNCETIYNRYSNASHNACIWDVYKNN